MAARKRELTDEPGLQVVKKARFGASQDETDSTTPNTIEDSATPPSPQSTEQQFSAPATSVTSRSRSSRRPLIHFCPYDECSKVYDRPNRLEAHVRTHTGDRPFVCKEKDCTKSFFKSEHLKAHMHNNHNDTREDHTCTYVLRTNANGEEVKCGRTFTTTSRLKRHVAAHEKREELKCTEEGCGLVFRKMETLQRHLRKDHLQEEEFRCSKIVQGDNGKEDEICGQTFPTVAKLKSHERREHRGLKHFCSVCSPTNGSEQVGFETYAELQAHNKAVHPPTCATCNRSFPSGKAMAAHMDIEHTSVSERQQYPCTHPGCDRSFNKKGNLKVHIQNVHVKTSKFVCGVTDLTSNEKCPGWHGNGCGMRFASKASLEDHVRTQHLDLPTMRKRRGAVKVKKEDGDSDVEMDIDEQSTFDDNMFGAGSNTLSLLTGYDYADTRPIACWTPGCSVRFSRDYDLAQHMEIAHGWIVTDINDRLAEQEALQGGKFWVGGAEEARDADGVFDDGYDGSFAHLMNESAMENGFVGDDMFTDQGTPMDGIQQFGVPDMKPFMSYEHDGLILDPALAGL